MKRSRKLIIALGALALFGCSKQERSEPAAAPALSAEPPAAEQQQRDDERFATPPPPAAQPGADRDESAAPGAAPGDEAPAMEESAPEPMPQAPRRSKRAEAAGASAAEQMIVFSDQLKVASVRFDRAIGLQVPNCIDAERYLGEICRLAQRICELNADAPSSAGSSRCEEGRSRCERAKKSFAEKCEG